MSITHVLSATTPDDPLYEIRPSHWNSAHAQALTISGNTAGQSTWSGTNLVYSGGPNATLSLNGDTLVFSGGAGAAGNTGYLSDGAGATASLGTVVFSNSNGLAFGINGQTVTGSYTVPTQSNQSAGIYALGNTTGQSSSSTYDARTLSVEGAGIVSVGWSNSSLRVSATQSNQAFSADASSTFQTLTLQNSNGISFSNNAGAIRITHDLAFSSQTNLTGRIYVTAQSTGQSSSSTYDLRSLSIVGDGIISAGWSASTLRLSATQSNQAFSAAGGSSAFQTLGFSDNAQASWTNTNGSVALTEVRASLFAASNTTQSSSGTQNIDALTFAGAGVASVGITNGSVVISVPSGGGAGDGGVFAGASNLGNTAGSTGTVSTGNFVLVGTNAISLSQSTGAAGSAATITIDAPRPVTLSGYDPYQGQIGAAVAGQNASLFFEPTDLPAAVQFDKIGIRITHSNASNSSGSATISAWVGFYTKNVSTLSLLASTSASTALTASGTAGSYSLYGGIKILPVPWTTTMSASNYWVGIVSRTTTGGANMTFGHVQPSLINSSMSGIFGSASNNSNYFRQGQGAFSVSTAGLPNSVAFSDVRGHSVAQFRIPVFLMMSEVF